MITLNLTKTEFSYLVVLLNEKAKRNEFTQLISTVVQDTDKQYSKETAESILTKLDTIK